VRPYQGGRSGGVLHPFNKWGTTGERSVILGLAPHDPRPEGVHRLGFFGALQELSATT